LSRASPLAAVITLASVRSVLIIQKEYTEDEETDEWLDVAPPERYQKPKVSRTFTGRARANSNSKKSGFLSNFFGKKKEDEDKPEVVQVSAQEDEQEQRPYEQHYDPYPQQQQHVQHAHTPTNQLSFTDNLQDDYNQPAQFSESVPMDRETQEIEIIRQLLNAYFAIVLKNIGDSVPKAIMHFLVNKSKSNMQSELVRNLYKEDLFDDLLRENDEIALKRKATAKMLKVLQRAQDIINEVRDLKL
jgi:heme-degrading monooxygenase HmoA